MMHIISLLRSPHPSQGTHTRYSFETCPSALFCVVHQRCNSLLCNTIGHSAVLLGDSRACMAAVQEMMEVLAQHRSTTFAAQASVLEIPTRAPAMATQASSATVRQTLLTQICSSLNHTRRSAYIPSRICHVFGMRHTISWGSN